MASSIPPHSSFEISSDALCFGSRNEVREGASQPLQSPTCAEFGGGGDGRGTVLVHSYQYNFQALSGQWNVFRLQEISGKVTAAFCCHQNIDPYGEAKRILEVANSPYEEDNGTIRNTPQTWEGRVLVVNRYDWAEDYYTEKEDGIEVGEEHLMGDGQRNSRWLVDYMQAMDTMESDDPVEDWVHAGKGVRLVVFGEYIFGRFGLTDDRSAVHSFLMFTSDTQLSQTSFQGDPTHNRFIYVPLTPEQRHAKRLADGSYLGYHWLRTSKLDPAFFQNLVPPFEVESMILPAQIQSILNTVQPRVTDLEPQLQSESVQLLNETMAVWIHSMGNHAETASSKEDFLRKALSKAYGPNQSHIHAQILKKMNSIDCAPVTMDRDMVHHKIVPSDTKLWEFVTIDQISRGVKYLLEEILELAANCALDNQRSVLVPYDLRVAINNDVQFCEEGMNTSQVFWPPDMIIATSQEGGEDERK